MLFFDKFARLLGYDGRAILIIRFGILCVDGLRYSDGLLFFVDLDRFVVCDLVQDSTSTKVFDSALGVDAAIQHTHEVVRPRKNQLYVMRDKNLVAMRTEG